MEFRQSPPTLSNPWSNDHFLQRYCAATLPDEFLAAHRKTYESLGALAVSLYPQQLAEIRIEPSLTQWDAWGHRIDHIELTPLWQRAREITAEWGLIAEGHNAAHGQWARHHQMTMNFLVQGSLDIYSCPLAMTDGAATTLRAFTDNPLFEKAFAHLTARDDSAWTSGQWMTERTGGSDVSRSQTIATPADDGSWRLTGDKWFTSATTSEMALTLARPEGNPQGSSGLALFYVETRTDDGTLNNISINRLKDKLGTRKVPTAELSLRGTRAHLVSGRVGGVKAIAPMLNVTRMWNATMAVCLMRRMLLLAGDYAHKRFAFGQSLAENPLHRNTLANIEVQTRAAFLAAFRVVELLGSPQENADILRVLTPLAKLQTGKQAVTVTSEAMECFGGAGYVEDTGIPRLVADAHVLPIWEGTTNVLAVDTLRTLANAAYRDAFADELRALLPQEEFSNACQRVLQLAGQAQAVLRDNGGETLANARAVALTIARVWQSALMLQLAAKTQHDSDIAAAKRFLATVPDIQAWDQSGATAVLSS